MEPDAELPSDFEDRQRSAMVARDRVTRCVTGPPYFSEELRDLTREDALVLQASKQVVLGLLRET